MMGDLPTRTRVVIVSRGIRRPFVGAELKTHCAVFSEVSLAPMDHPKSERVKA